MKKLEELKKICQEEFGWIAGIEEAFCAGFLAGEKAQMEEERAELMEKMKESL